jgi:hypothetical protein
LSVLLHSNTLIFKIIYSLNLRILNRIEIPGKGFTKTDRGWGDTGEDGGLGELAETKVWS